MHVKDKFDKKMWWEYISGHANIWFDNWTELGSLHYVLPITHRLIEGYEDVHHIMEHDGWNMFVMTELLNK